MALIIHGLFMEFYLKFENYLNILLFTEFINFHITFLLFSKFPYFFISEIKSLKLNSLADQSFYLCNVCIAVPSVWGSNRIAPHIMDEHDDDNDDSRTVTWIFPYYFYHTTFLAYAAYIHT